jgi:ubiquinone/menaquinone biosynthesis C-methylase UbiE
MPGLPPIIAVANELPHRIAERVLRERDAHEDDHIAANLQKWWSRFPHVFTNPSMLSLHRFYQEQLGDVRGKTVLEYGCGKGDFAAWLSTLGAYVVGIDISEFNIARCNTRFGGKEPDSKSCRFYVMDAHLLQFADSSFDVVLGNGIIHHLDLPTAMKEVDRVLKPGGVALFQEPLGDNPLLKFYRHLARYHTEDERPLSRRELAYLENEWHVLTKFSGLFTMPVAILTSFLLRPFPNNWLLRLASAAEEIANRRRLLRHWNRMAVFLYQKP